MAFPVVYQPATKAASGPMPGAKVLMAWCLANYPPGTNLGIYNPRSVRGGTALSLHAEGRALDVGFPVYRPEGHAVGWWLAGAMRTHHAEIGVQCIIFARKIWSNTRPTWRPYGGTADHFDHVHIELTREAAAGLTTDIIRQTMGATTVPTPTTPLPENHPGARIQRAINDNGLTPPLKVDGDPGKLTADGLDAVLAYLNGVVADLSQANATRAETIKRLTAEREESAHLILKLRQEEEIGQAEYDRVRAEVARMQVLDTVARQGPAIVARVQALRAALGGELLSVEADLARLTGGR